MPYFSEDYDDSKVFECVGFETPWNGWATPIVTREVLTALGQSWADEGGHAEGLAVLTWHGATAAIATVSDPDAPYLLVPDSAGLYHLGELGFCFVREDPDPEIYELKGAHAGFWYRRTNRVTGEVTPQGPFYSRESAQESIDLDRGI